MYTLENNLKESPNIGNLGSNIEPHWAYYIAGSIFVIIFIVSVIFTYYFITHPFSKKTLEELKGFKKFKIKNRVAFFLMLDIISILCIILFMMNGS